MILDGASGSQAGCGAVLGGVRGVLSGMGVSQVCCEECSHGSSVFCGDLFTFLGAQLTSPAVSSCTPFAIRLCSCNLSYRGGKDFGGSASPARVPTAVDIPFPAGQVSLWPPGMEPPWRPPFSSPHKGHLGQREH